MRKSLLWILPILIILSASAFFFHKVGNSPASLGSAQAGAILSQFHAPGKDFADPAYCVECHRKETEAWQGSHHHLANDPLSEADRERLLKARQTLLEERGMGWRKSGKGVVLDETGLPAYPVIGKIGLTPLVQYLHLAPDGRLQAHDIAWDVEKEEWFSVFELDDRGEEVPRQPGEWGHWSGQGMNWDANCAYCHMTEYEKGYDAFTDTYNRQWSHMGITCAQCHPGMDVHLSQVRNGNNDFKESLTPEQIMEYCAACHARRDELTPHHFRAGDDFEDHFQLTLADVPGIYHPDGQVIGENYVYGSLTMSRMGHAGITCMDCHDPHTNGLILPFENNALCQRCHGSGLKDAPRIDPVAHSHHPANSTGNLCVECHMPKTYFMGRDGRRDHSFSHPDPLLTMEMGIPNACIQCHNTQSNEWAKRYIDEWYGPGMNAERREKARLMRDLFAATSGTDARLRAAIESEENRFWKATFVSMMRYTPPTRENFEVLLEGTAHPDPMVRSAAVRATGLESLPMETQTALLEDPKREVRIAAATASQSLRTAEGREEELHDYLQHTSDTPLGSLRYAAYWQSRGDPAKAAQIARQATRFEPLNPEVWRLAAVQLHGLGLSNEAMEYLDKALELDPGNPQALFNRGLLQYETGDSQAALSSLLRAVESEPAFEDAWYNLIVLYWEMNQRETARDYIRKAQGHLPESNRLRQLSRQLR